MIKDMIVSSTALETRVAILEDDQLAELYIERHRNRGILANTYKGKVTKVLPGMQSAFVNIGLEKDAFLYVSDFVEENEDLDTEQPVTDEPVDLVAAAAESEVSTAEARPQRRERRGDRGDRNNRWRERRERADAARTSSGDGDVPGEVQPETSVSSESEAVESVESKMLRSEKTEMPAENESLPEASATPSCEENVPTTLTTADSSNVVEEVHTEEADTPVADVVIPSSEPQIAETSDTSEEITAVVAETTKTTESVDTPVTADKSTVIAEVAREPKTSKKEEQKTADSASIRDDGEQMPFVSDKEDSDGGRGGFSRRRGMATRRKRYTAVRHTPPRAPEHHSIDDMLREGQEVLVQVAKEPIARKGARVTSHIALPGRYLVYMPTVDHVGVSRKIGSDGERMRLKDIILRHRDQFPGGVIVRTAAAEHSEEDLVNDLRFLVRIWDDMRTKAERVSAPALIHAEMSLVQRLLRDQFSFEFASIRVDDDLEYQRVVEFVDKIYPNLVHRVKLHTKENSIFDEYGITSEIDKLLQPKIWLKSGGYIVINQTEALVSIDINTGKFVGRGNSLEETITRTNLEAVKEIVRQVRLRDLGGIIVIDFIDMDERKNRKRVMEALSEEIARDKAPSKILEFNEFGLVAITRKRVKQSLERTLCQACPYCSGSGMVKSVSTTCHNIYHEVEKMRGIINDRSELMIRVHPDVAKALRETEVGVIDELRHILRRDVIVKADPALHIEHFNIVN